MIIIFIIIIVITMIIITTITTTIIIILIIIITKVPRPASSQGKAVGPHVLDRSQPPHTVQPFAIL
jgi:hypothetical protein